MTAKLLTVLVAIALAALVARSFHRNAAKAAPRPATPWADRPWQDDPDALWRAIVAVESGGNPRAVGDGGRAVGIVQIHKILVDDVNRITGRSAYSYDDRLSPVFSRSMWAIYLGHYARGRSNEFAARCWNGGPTGHRKAATLPYWAKVHAAHERQVTK